MDFDSQLCFRARQGQVEEHFMRKHDLDSCPYELSYAVEEALKNYNPETIGELYGTVEYVFQCEWDGSITECVPIFEEREEGGGPRTPTDELEMW